MKRPVIRVTLVDPDAGQELHRSIRSAHNAGIRASESAVREFARATGELFTGDRPNRVGPRYSRTWTGECTGRVLVAAVVTMP